MCKQDRQQYRKVGRLQAIPPVLQLGSLCHHQIIIHFSPPLLDNQRKYGREVLLLLCPFPLRILLGINSNRYQAPAPWCSQRLRQTFRRTVEFLFLFLRLLRNLLHQAIVFLVLLPLVILNNNKKRLIESDSTVLWPDCFKISTRCSKILEHWMTQYQNLEKHLEVSRITVKPVLYSCNLFASNTEKIKRSVFHIKEYVQ